jgi:hypothetical protein
VSVVNTSDPTDPKSKIQISGRVLVMQEVEIHQASDPVDGEVSNGSTTLIKDCCFAGSGLGNMQHSICSRMWAKGKVISHECGGLLLGSNEVRCLFLDKKC